MVTEMRVEDLNPHPMNREIYTAKTDIDGLMDSIEEMGLLEPVVVTPGGTIISGHRRVLACKRLGWGTIDARTMNITEDEEIAHLVDFNRYRTKTASEILNEVQTLKEYYGDRRKKGVRSNTNLKGKKTRTLMSERLGVPETTIAKLEKIQKHRPSLIRLLDEGDITIDHAYRHLNKIMRVEEYRENIQEQKKRYRKRKSIEGETFKLFCKSSASMPQIEDQSVQMVFTSPPYWQRRDYSSKHQIGQEKTLEEYFEAMRPVMNECFRVLRDTGSFFIELGDFYSNGVLTNFPHRLLFKILEWNPWCHQNVLVWRKTNYLRQSSASKRWNPSHSYIFFLTKTTNSYTWNIDSIKEPSVHLSRGGKEKVHQMNRVFSTSPSHDLISSKTTLQLTQPYCLPSDILEAPVGGFSPEKEVGMKIHHPASFSRQIIENPLLATTDPDDLVLDPFTGTSTTGDVAIDNGRRFVGFDTNPDFIEASRRRLLKKENEKVAV